METKITSLSRGDTVTVSTEQRQVEDLTVYGEEDNDSTVRVKNGKYAYKIKHQSEKNGFTLINETKGYRLGLIKGIQL